MLEDLVSNRYKWSKPHEKAYRIYRSYFDFLGSHLYFDVIILDFMNKFSIDFDVEDFDFDRFRRRSEVYLDTLDFASDALSSFSKVMQQVSNLKITHQKDIKDRHHVLQTFKTLITMTKDLIRTISEVHGLDNNLVKLIDQITKHFLSNAFIGTVQGLHNFIVKNHEVLMKKPKLFEKYFHLFFSNSPS